MNLMSKLMASYLLVIAVGLGILTLSTAFIAPVDFSNHMSMMGNGTMGNGMMGGNMAQLSDQLESNFRQTLDRALLIAAGAASMAAVAVSLYVGQRLLRPIRQLVNASHHIAEGHYDERLHNSQRDELGELTRSFNRMAAALAETEIRRQQLIADVSHELKTPLASIKGYMEGLQDGIIPANPETFQLIHREADRLQRLVQDLQELSRAEASQLQLDKQAHILKELVEPAIASLQPQFQEKGVQLAVDLPDESLRVLADVDRIRQVLINLLGNALVYTSAGGQVTVSAKRVDDSAQISVQDTGIGLAPADLDRIFQRFYRVDKSRSRASGGSGIGLTIARHIVEAHDGRLWAESRGPDQGSTFYFTLPLTSSKLHNSDIPASK